MAFDTVTMKLKNDIAKVSVFSRALAWLYVAMCVFIVASLLFRTVKQGEWPVGVAETLLLSLAVLVVGPLFFHVAWRGRSPGWLSSMENIYDAEAKRRGLLEKGAARPRRLVAVVAALAFGGFEVAFATWIGVLSDDGGLFPVLVFALGWLVVAILIWRYFNKKPADG